MRLLYKHQSSWFVLVALDRTRIYFLNGQSVPLLGLQHGSYYWLRVVPALAERPNRCTTQACKMASGNKNCVVLRTALLKYETLYSGTQGGCAEYVRHSRWML